MDAMPLRLSKTLLPDIASALWKANDISFQDRLKHLFELLEPDTIALITTDRDRFISAIKDTRNQFTHVEQRKKSKAFHRLQWRDAADKALAILFIHMLKLCGLPEAEICTRMKRSKRFGTNPFEFVSLKRE